VAVAFAACACQDAAQPAGDEALDPQDSGQGEAWEYRGAWLAPRSDHPLDSEEGTRILRQMRDLGIRQVAVGHDVNMPKVTEAHLTWGKEDAALRGFLRRARQVGLATFLLPRIESPDFFQPPFPFRGDIRFATAAEWDRFHNDMERMILHYAQLAQDEGVALLGLGLELKHSVRGHPQRWRRIIAKVRKIYRGKITYSANWWSEWQEVTFWDALDFIGIGAYFELKPQPPESSDAQPGTASRQQLLRRWRLIRQRLRLMSDKYGRRVIFTEVGYAGYKDCAERPWEWAGKQEKGAPLDHRAQARAYGALFDLVRSEPCVAGLFVWRFYTFPEGVAAWEYGLQGRPAEKALRQAYGPVR
jgi:hypothetical protein